MNLIEGSLCQGALSLLAENAELNEEDGRGIAFRRAGAVLKALPRAVRKLTELKGLPCLGEHSLRVIKASRKGYVFLCVQSFLPMENFSPFFFSLLI